VDLVPLAQNSCVTSVRLLSRLDRQTRPQHSDALGDLLRHQLGSPVGTAGCGKCGRKFLSRKRQCEHYALAHSLDLD
jgi:hypothetical protein